MRTSLRRLRGIALQRNGEPRDRRDRRLPQSVAHLDELARASQDMQDMRDCYDSLLSSAATTANSAYEFSDSLRELGACLLEKTALNDDEESGKVLLMLGKLQFELQKLVDNYRSHIVQTITSPSESLLNELRIVEEMKRQCDDKRSVYEYMITTQKEKGKPGSSKGEKFSSQQLQAAYDEYDEEATLFVFRSKSLKQGQSRSLLTQAARHHAAQLCFFRRALKSLETVEPHVKLVTEQQHIDYQFSGLEDDADVDVADNGDSDFEEDSSDDGSYDGHDDSELSFDYGPNNQRQNVVSTPRDSMELDHVDITLPEVAQVDAAKEYLDRYPSGYVFAVGRELKTSSQSAPLSAEKKFDPAERLRQIRPLSTRKFHSYVLPIPVDPKSPVSTGTNSQVPQTRQSSLSVGGLNYRHSSPLEQTKYEKMIGNEKLSGPISPSEPSVLRETDNNAEPPLTEEVSSELHDRPPSSSTKKMKIQAFSGPLAGSNKLGLSASSPPVARGPTQLFSGPLLRTPIPRPSSSPALSQSASPSLVSSPKINELHELPRPPTYLASKFVGRPSNKIGYSGPLVSKGQQVPAAYKFVSSLASPLPVPPLTLPRSFSNPSSGQQMNMSMPLQQTPKISDDIASPLSPIPLPNDPPTSS